MRDLHRTLLIARFEQFEVSSRQVVAPLSVYGAVETALRHLNSRGHRVTFVLFSRDPRSCRGIKGVRRWSPKIASGQRECATYIARFEQF